VERDKALTEAMKVVWDKPPEAEPFDSIAVATLTFTQNLLKPKHEQFKQIATFLNGFRPRPPRHAEAPHDRDHRRAQPRAREKWPEGAIETLVRVTREAEEAAAIDSRCFTVGSREAREGRHRANGMDCAIFAFHGAPTRCARQRSRRSKRLAKITRPCGRRPVRWLLRIASTRKRVPSLWIWRSLTLTTLWPVGKSSRRRGTRWPMTSGRFNSLLRPPASPALPNVGELGRAAQSLRAGREQLRAALRVPDAATARQLRESAAMAALVALGAHAITHAPQGG